MENRRDIVISTVLTVWYIDLKKSKEAAETAAAAKQNFLANMSHGNHSTYKEGRTRLLILQTK